MFQTLLVLWFAVVAVMVVPKLNPFTFKVKTVEPPKPETSVIHLYSGPNDGQVHEIRGSKDELPHFFVTPYLPRDENGDPVPDEERMVPGASGMVFLKPALAYYQQVTDNDYIYVRDINENEFQKIRMTGEPPKFQVDE